MMSSPMVGELYHYLSDADTVPSLIDLFVIVMLIGTNDEEKTGNYSIAKDRGHMSFLLGTILCTSSFENWHQQ